MLVVEEVVTVSVVSEVALDEEDNDAEDVDVWAEVELVVVLGMFLLVIEVGDVGIVVDSKVEVVEKWLVSSEEVEPCEPRGVDEELALLVSVAG